MGPYFGDNTHCFEEQAASCPFETEAAGFAGQSGVADVLARESPGDAVNFVRSPWAKLTYVDMASGSGKSLSKDSPVERVEFDLPFGFPAGLFEAEVKASDPGEEAADSGLVIMRH